MLILFDDKYFAFVNKSAADSVLPMGAYQNMLDVGLDPRDIQGRYWRYVRFPEHSVIDVNLVPYETSPPLEQPVVWMEAEETGELI